MRHGIWAFRSEPCTERSKSTTLKTSRRLALLLSFAALVQLSGCGIYSMSGAATKAKTISVDQFFNNTDLAPANLAQDFTNRVKDYYQQNSSVRVIPENGELQMEGTITEYRLTPQAPTANTTTATNPQATSTAALTRLTIGIKVTYVDSTDPKNSFKDKAFSFFQDFDNNENLTNIQDDLHKKIFDQILIDMFNATVANW